MKHIFTVVVLGFCLSSNLIAEPIKFSLSETRLFITFPKEADDEVFQATCDEFDSLIDNRVTLEKITFLSVDHNQTRSIDWLLKWLPKLPSLKLLFFRNVIEGEKIIKCLNTLPAPEKIRNLALNYIDFSEIDINTLIFAINRLKNLKNLNLNHVNLNESQVEALIHKVQETTMIMINQNNAPHCYINGEIDHQAEDMFD